MPGQRKSQPKPRAFAHEPWRFPFGLLTILDLMGGARHRSEGTWGKTRAKSLSPQTN
jgi:hypothetical protein